MNKQQRNKFILIIVALCLTLSLLCTSLVYAWFAINSEVEQNNLKINAYVTPNLIISNDSSKIASLSTDSVNPFSVSHVLNTNNKFLPCTHYKDVSDTLLKYVTNTGDVDQTTGLAPSYSYGDVTTGTDGNSNYFYIDYIVYIASTGVELTNTDLVATMTGSFLDSDGNKSTLVQNTFNAASIDFYVNDTFKGTLNVAGKDASLNDGTSEKTSLTLISAGTIPLNTSSYITIKMRCYFDGALKMTSTSAYVSSATIAQDYAVLDVKFSATEK